MTTSTTEIENQIKNLDENYKVAINELSKSFPPSKAFPNDKNLEKAFEKDTFNLNKIQSNFFILNDTLKKQLKEKSNLIEKINKSIQTLERENKKLNDQANMLLDTKRGSVQMAKDTQYLYQVRFVENILLFIGTLIIGYKLFTRKR